MSKYSDLDRPYVNENKAAKVFRRDRTVCSGDKNMTERKKHFVVPDSIVKKEKFAKRGFDVNYDDHETHGPRILSDLRRVEESYAPSSGSPDYLSGSDTRIFKAVMREGVKVEGKAEKLKNNGLLVNAVPDQGTAIVSTDRTRFDSLMADVEKYSETGGNKTNLQFIDRFEPYTGSEKRSGPLRERSKAADRNEMFDIELMLLPKLSERDYTIALERMTSEIVAAGGKIEEGPFRLSNTTPIMRIEVSSLQLDRLGSDPVVYRMAETSFFELSPAGNTPFNDESKGSRSKCMLCT